MKSIVKTLLVTAVTAVMATSANAADLVLKFGHVGKPGSLFDMSANEFGDWPANAASGLGSDHRLFDCTGEYLGSDTGQFTLYCCSGWGASYLYLCSGYSNVLGRAVLSLEGI